MNCLKNFQFQAAEISGEYFKLRIASKIKVPGSGNFRRILKFQNNISNIYSTNLFYTFSYLQLGVHCTQMLSGNYVWVFLIILIQASG